MTMPIQSESRATHLSTNELADLDQRTDQYVGELKKSVEEISDNEPIKKKRPEDATDSLAVMASIAWSRQPVEIKSLAEQAGSLNRQINAIKEGTADLDCHAGRGDHGGSTVSKVDYSGSQFAEQHQLSSSQSDASKKSFSDRSSVLAAIGKPDSAQPVKSAIDDTLEHDVSGHDAMLAPANLSGVSIGSSGQAALPSNPSSKSNEASGVDTSSLNGTTLGRERIDGSGDRASSFTVSDKDGAMKPGIVDAPVQHVKVKKEDDPIDSAQPQVMMPAQPLPVNIIPEMVPQQSLTGRHGKNTNEQARAAQAGQRSGTVEGIKYKLDSWGVDKSVEITGSAQKGYVLHASDSEVKQVLDRHADNSLNLTVAARDDE
ncbi:hypothetical protein AAKU67_002732 [Oxalobacteraceae bacterium GrIS 2.11]